MAAGHTWLYHAAGVYHSREREYWLGFRSGQSVVLLKFNFYTGAWTKTKENIGSTIGAADFLEVKDKGSRPKLLKAVDADQLGLLVNSLVEEDVGYDADLAALARTVSPKFKTKFYDCGKPYEDKKFVAALLHIKSTQNVTVDVLCDDHLDTSEDSSGFTAKVPGGDMIWWDGALPAGVGNVWGAKNWGSGKAEGNVLVMLDTRTWGKRIALEISTTVGNATNFEFNAVTFFYKPLGTARGD